MTVGEELAEIPTPPVRPTEPDEPEISEPTEPTTPKDPGTTTLPKDPVISEGSNLPSAPDNPAMSTKQPHVDQNVALSKATENENAKDLELTKLPQLSEQTKPSIVGTFFVMLASLLGLGSLLDKKRKDQ